MSGLSWTFDQLSCDLLQFIPVVRRLINCRISQLTCHTASKIFSQSGTEEETGPQWVTELRKIEIGAQKEFQL
ncbi:hypothetical protein RRG08_037108 [Elysia crispata]|uniref:Uncharacterized protein n=1 Tax=Elysia crispata TaxID=231223 RepID=A0AAE1CSW0_9GAST|nr:hypothetical protein RRG08_037108 [Elysia crispata]